MKVDIGGGAYKQPYWHINSQRCVNWYPKLSGQKEKNKESMVLMPTPGCIEYADTGENVVRRLFTSNDKMYCVAGNNFYDISNGVATLLGALTGANNNRPYMEKNANNEILISIYPDAWWWDEDTQVLTKVTNVNFSGLRNLTFSDGYFLGTANNRVEYNELNDASDWRGDNFFTPGFKTDNTKAVVASHEEINCFGNETIEHYVNDGTTPFVRQSRSSTTIGIAAVDSIALSLNGVFFVGKSKRGGYSVYVLGADYLPKKISPPSIDHQLKVAGAIETAFGFVEDSDDGHSFYHISIPDIDKTFSFDFTTQEWHERQSVKPYTTMDGSFLYGAWRANDLQLHKGDRYIADRYSGKILKLDNSVYTEGGLKIKRIRSTRIYAQEDKYIPAHSLQIDVNSGSGLLSGQGSNPVLMLRTSKDGGVTYSPRELLSLGITGDFKHRVKTNLLGTARNWTLEISVTDPVPVILLGAFIDN